MTVDTHACLGLSPVEMDIEQILAWHTLPAFNDLELYEGLRDVEEGLTVNPVSGLRVFGQHGSGSQYALFEGHAVWIDSEGEQYTIARNLDELVDALHLDAGALYDAMARCQGASYLEADALAPLDALKAKFDAAWLDEAAASAREGYAEGYPLFEERARAAGRGVPRDLAERLFALRDFTRRLRKACMT